MFFEEIQITITLLEKGNEKNSFQIKSKQWNLDCISKTGHTHKRTKNNRKFIEYGD